jgi:L-aspartate oxidase
LLEALAFGKALGERLAQRGPTAPITKVDPPAGHAVRAESANDQMVLARLRQIMWNEVGIIRTADGLQSAMHQIQVLERRCLVGSPVLRQLLAARLVVEACMRRRASIGAHHLDETPAVIPQSGQAVA